MRVPLPPIFKAKGHSMVQREVAAYGLDHQRWAGVPETVEMRIPMALFPPEVRAGRFQKGARFFGPLVQENGQHRCVSGRWSIF